MAGLGRRVRRARYLLERLSESPPSFLAQRARLALRRRSGRRRVVRGAAGGRRFSDGYEEGVGPVLDLLRALSEDLEAATAPQARARAAELVDEVDRGRVRCLGYGEHPLGTEGWQADPIHGHRWPRKYFARVDFLCPDVRADVKVPWEQSRLQWLVRAALGNRFEGDAARSEARHGRLLELLRHWIAANPYGMGVNWVSAMEVGLRAVNLLVALALLADRLERSTLRELLTSAGEHLHYLRRFPETSDVPGNHLLATELGILFLEGFRWGGQRDRPAAVRGLARGGARFVAVARAQFHPSGLHVEHAPGYHRLSLDMVVTGQALLSRLEPDAAAALEPVVRRALAASALLANGAGELPLFGDSDSGHVLDLGQGERTQRAYPAWAGGVPPHAAATHGDRLHAALLAGLAGPAGAAGNGGDAGDARAEAWHGTDEAGEAPAVREVPPFLVLEAADAKLVVRVGPHGLAGRAPHDHDDALSFWYSRAGRDLVVEAGPAPYTRAPEERAESLSSAAHNVVQVAGRPRHALRDGSVFATVRGGPLASVGACTADPVEGARVELALVGGSDAPALAERRLRLDAAGDLCLHERVRVDGAAGFEGRLHFPPGFRVTLEERGARVEGPEDALRVELEGPHDVSLAVETYIHHPAYGAGASAPCLLVRGPGGRTVELTLRLRASGPAATGAPARPDGSDGAARCT